MANYGDLSFNEDNPLVRNARQRSQTHFERQEITQNISKRMTELAQESDFVVIVSYDREAGLEPIDHALYNFKKDAAPSQVPTSLDFDGIRVWYFCKHDEVTFHARKLLIEMDDGVFENGQFGDFDGFWDEFSQYVANDRWIKSMIGEEQAP